MISNKKDALSVSGALLSMNSTNETLLFDRFLI